MSHMEKRLSGRTVFHGKLIAIVHDTVELENGRRTLREVVQHPGAVAILALDGDRIVLVRQYRYAIGRELLEIPAGKLEKDEQPLAAAVRELSEETGGFCTSLTPLGEYFGSPGVLGERISLFFGRLSSTGDQHPDEDEFLSVVRLTPEELRQRVAGGEITDGKTLAALTLAREKGFLDV
ncbi:MAG: NUDIX hydrolase [Clostridiaceae bacterium]|nr:NUDIX hydrolase [Clostridiaceae bacterium]